MPEPIREYKIVTRQTEDKLSEKVNDILAKDEGWQPEGPLVICALTTIIFYSQVMTKRRRLPE